MRCVQEGHICLHAICTRQLRLQPTFDGGTTFPSTVPKGMQSLLLLVDGSSQGRPLPGAQRRAGGHHCGPPQIPPAWPWQQQRGGAAPHLPHNTPATGGRAYQQNIGRHGQCSSCCRRRSSAGWCQAEGSPAPGGRVCSCNDRCRARVGRVVHVTQPAAAHALIIDHLLLLWGPGSSGVERVMHDPCAHMACCGCS